MGTLKIVKDYWFLFPIVGGFTLTFANLPRRLEAVEKKAVTVEQRTEKVEQYIQAIEEQKKLLKVAPPGWIWSEKEEKYLPDPYYVPPPKKRSP